MSAFKKMSIILMTIFMLFIYLNLDSVYYFEFGNAVQAVSVPTDWGSGWEQVGYSDIRSVSTSSSFTLNENPTGRFSIAFTFCYIDYPDLTNYAYRVAAIDTSNNSCYWSVDLYPGIYASGGVTQNTTVFLGIFRKLKNKTPSGLSTTIENETLHINYSTLKGAAYI